MTDDETKKMRALEALVRAADHAAVAFATSGDPIYDELASLRETADYQLGKYKVVVFEAKRS